MPCGVTLRRSPTTTALHVTTGSRGSLLDPFRDPAAAAVGGRDIVVWNGVVVGEEDGLRAVVGRVGVYGRVTGNHHRGLGPGRPVDALKGANMAFRTGWARRFGFDERLRGAGAQVDNDLMLCLQIRRAGGKLIYDPNVVVYHYPAPRPAGDAAVDRPPATMVASSDEVHNETLALMEFLPARRRALYLIWVFAWGTRRRPGLGLSLVSLARSPRSALPTLAGCCRGRIDGVVTWRGPRAAR